MRLSIFDVFVITYRQTDCYSFDTGLPDEVFTIRAEADMVAAENNESTKKLTLSDGTDRFFVQTLADRIETIRDECRSEGESTGERY